MDNPALSRARWACLLVACVLSGCGGLRIATESYHVKADDGFELQAYRQFEWKGAGSERRVARGVLCYVQGSEDRTVQDVTGELAGAAAMGLDVLMVERRGVSSDGSVNNAIANHFCTKVRRVGDHLAVLNDYLERHKAGGPVILMGASEGGDVAAAMAAQESRVSHLILLGSGGGMTQAEELRLLVKRSPGAFGLADEAQLDAALKDIRSNPESDREWLGHPYRRWSSFALSPPLDVLRTVVCPILLLHGDVDSQVPVESARALRDTFAAEGKSNLIYVEYSGVDHSLRHVASGRTARPLVEIDTVQWLAGLGVLPERESGMYVTRVKRAHPEWFDRNGQRR